MKNSWLITFRSVTFAQKAQSALSNAGIRCTMQRTPRTLSERGCGYCLWVRWQDAPDAVRVLQERQIAFGKIYEMEDGRPQERHL